MRTKRQTPTGLKKLRGNPGKRALPRHEPEGVGGLGDPPAGLDKEQREAWRITAAAAPPGLLTETDRDIFRAYIVASVNHMRANIEINANGFTVETSTGTPIQNPAVGVLHRSAELMAKLGAEMGFSPSARASIGLRIMRETGANGAKQAGSPPPRGSVAEFLASKPESDVIN
jgi:P27 family predicted phage terminase small subunit